MSQAASPPRGNHAAQRAWRFVLAQVPRMSHPATGYVLVFMVLAGLVLRIQNIGHPFYYCFDESQYVGAAHQFLIGVPDTGECCHPPLSKLLIGVGMVLFGNTPFGWRFMPLVFGVQNIVLVFLIASTLFKDRRAGWLAAAFLSADGFYLVYSRVGLPDGILACFVLWCVLAAVTAEGVGGVLACAILVGAAASLKWVAVLVGLPACFAILLRRRAPWWSLVAFAVVPFVHLGIWMIGLRLIGHPYDVASVIAEIRHRAGLHLGFRHATNPLESPWFSWLVLYHPILVKSAQTGTTVRLASSVGNPLLWIAADASLLGLLLAGIAFAFRRGFRARWSTWFDGATSKGFAILGVSWVSMMLLWFTRRIVTYWYHYLTSWGLAITLVAGVAWSLDRRYPRLVLAFVLLVLAVAIYFAPVWAELPISVSAAHRRLIFPLWR